MKKLTLYLLFLVATLAASASGTWNLQGNTYTIDTLFHAKIGPGTTQTSLKLTGALKLRVFYTTTDLTDPYVEMRNVKAGDKLAAVATVSSMAKSKSKEGAKYFAGVNADFFGNSKPIGTTVVDKEVYYSVDDGWRQWAIDANKVPYIGALTISGKVTKGESTNVINNINVGRDENDMIIYTPRFGSSTSTNQYGTEAVITPVSGTMAVGETVKMKVTGSPSDAGNMTIPSGAYVLSGHGTSRTFVRSLSDGDEIEVTINFKQADGTEFAPTQVSGGLPVILSDGKVLDTQGALDHLTALNPRTAIGHDATKTKLVMMVVDGRSTISQGCVSRVLADMMREVGCTEALNFDGGGSSALYTSELGVRNVPSDGTERTVTNAVFAVSTAPTDNEIASIGFAIASQYLPKYSFYKPTIYGYNKYGDLISTDVQGYTLSCGSELGTISEDGSTLLIKGDGCHLLTATLGNATASIPISVSSSVNCRYTNITTDSYNDYKIDMYSISGDQTYSLDNTVFTWTSDDTSIATVDENGVVHGVKNGATTVTGTVDGDTYKIDVNVEIPTVRYQDIDPNLDPSTWTFAVTSMQDENFSAFGNSGMAIDYTTTSSRRLYINLAKDLQLWSLPDSILYEINTTDEVLSSIDFVIADRNNVEYEYSYYLNSYTANAVNKVFVPIGDIVDVENVSLYPLTLKSMKFVMGDKSGTTHRLEIAKFATVYNAIPGSSGIENIADGGNACNGLIIAPNPVKAGETAKLNVDEPVEYAVYNVNGVLAAQGNGTDIATADLSAGVYIVTANVAGKTATAKLVVK